MTAIVTLNYIYRSVPHIHPLLRISPPYIFNQSSCTGIFIPRIGPPNHAHSTKMIFIETPTLSSSRSPWQCKKEATVHRTAKKFAVDRKHVREWCQSATAHHVKGQTCAVYAVANLCQSILTIEFSGARGTGHRISSEGRSAACNTCIMFTSRCGTGRGGVFAR